MPKKNFLSEEKVFSDVINQIQILKALQPNENWVISNRSKLAFRMEMQRKKNLLKRDISTLKELFASWPAMTPQRAFKAVYAFSILGAMVLGGGTLTALGAVKSLPGSPLYPVKIKMEKVALWVSPSDQKDRMQDEMTTRRLEELKIVINRESSADDKKEGVNSVTANLRQQLIADKDQFSQKTDQASVAVSAKVAYQRAEQVKRAIVEVKGALPIEVKANLSETLSAVADIADKTSLQTLAILVAKNDKTEADTQEILDRFAVIINQKELAIKAIAESSQADVTGSIADKLPIKSINAVLVNQAGEAVDLLNKLKEYLNKQDFNGALATLGALNEIVKSAEKIAENVDIQIALDAIMSISSSTANNATTSASSSTGK